jgi:hypothetical protein
VVSVAGSLAIAHFISARIVIRPALHHPSVFPTASPSSQPLPPSAQNLASLLTVLAASPQTPGVTVDVPLATRIVDAMWPIREQALDTFDVGPLHAFETGSALEGDTDAIGTRLCGCSDPLPRPIVTHNLFVPVQTTFPSSFLSEATTGSVEGSPPDVSLMVFTRASAQDHWMLSLETGYSFAAGAAWVYATPAPMTGGFDIRTPVGTYRNDLPGDLAAYYQHWADYGAPPPKTPFGPGLFTSTVGQTEVTEDTTLAGEGQVHHVVYSADPGRDGDWSFAANETEEQPTYGWALSCGTVRYEAVTTLAKGAAPMVQPSDVSTWGPTLPAGQYTKITQWGLHQSCFLDGPNGSPYMVLGQNGGITRSVGVSVGLTA